MLMLTNAIVKAVCKHPLINKHKCAFLFSSAQLSSVINFALLLLQRPCFIDCHEYTSVSSAQGDIARRRKQHCLWLELALRVHSTASVEIGASQ